jgi:GTP-binding protein HflX
LIAFNKLDLLPDHDTDAAVVCQRVLGNTVPAETMPPCVAVSAKTGQGFDQLLAKIDSMLPLDPLVTVRFRFPHSEGAALSFVHEYGRVLEKNFEEGYSEVVAEVPESVRNRLAQYIQRPADV